MRASIQCGVVVLSLAMTPWLPPGLGWIGSAQAQPAQNAAPAGQQLTQAALDQLVAPIALYPDDLLSVVLAASTQPLQIVEAQRFLDQHKADPSLKAPTDWDPSVVALLNYPDVLSMMNHDLDWTQQLGNAMIAQQTDVLTAIQAFRKKVYDAGNLKSNDKQTVKTENQAIVVQSADPQTIYVPQYDPQVVVAPVAVGAPAPYYYSQPYPYYASPAATFATGAVLGTAVGFAIGWGSHAIYSGNYGWGGYYGGGGSASFNRTNNVNINNNNVRLTDAQRTQFQNQVTQNRENAWHPDRTAAARQQASLGAQGTAGRVNAADIRSGLSNQGGAAGRTVSPQARQTLQQNQANRGGTAGRTVSPQARQTMQQNPGNRGGTAGHQPGAGIGNRAPNTVAANRPSVQANRPSFEGQHPNQAGGRPAFQSPGGAFSGSQNGAAANRFSNRGAASLRASNGFGGGGGGRFQGGGGFQGGGAARGGGGFHGRR